MRSDFNDMGLLSSFNFNRNYSRSLTKLWGNVKRHKNGFRHPDSVGFKMLCVGPWFVVFLLNDCRWNCTHMDSYMCAEGQLDEIAIGFINEWPGHGFQHYGMVCRKRNMCKS